jgi:hypothetical protein
MLQQPNVTYALGADVLVLVRLLDAVPVSLLALVVSSVVLGLGHFCSQQKQLGAQTCKINTSSEFRYSNMLSSRCPARTAQRVRSISAASAFSGDYA